MAALEGPCAWGRRQGEKGAWPAGGKLHASHGMQRCHGAGNAAVTNEASPCFKVCVRVGAYVRVYVLRANIYIHTYIYIFVCIYGLLLLPGFEAIG